MESGVKYVQVICEFCKNVVEKPARFLGYNHTFCNRTCHGNYKLANPKLCDIEGCGKKHSARGLCQQHYDMERKNDPKRVESTRVSAKINGEKIRKKRQIDPIFDAKFKQKSRERDRKYRSQNTEAVKKRDLDRWSRPTRRYSRAKKCAENRGIEFNITLEEYSYLARNGNNCYYECGDVVSRTGIGLDRKDNTKGYTLDNAVPCCGFCNVTKNAHISSEEMLEIVKLLKSMRKVENIWEDSKSGREINKLRVDDKGVKVK